MATRGVGQQANPVKLERVWAKQVDQLAEQAQSVAALLRGAGKLPAGQLGVTRGNAQAVFKALDKILDQRFSAPLSDATLQQAKQSLTKLGRAHNDMEKIVDKNDAQQVPKGAVMYEPKKMWFTVDEAIAELSAQANRTGKPHASKVNNSYVVANPGQSKQEISKAWENAPGNKRDPLASAAFSASSKLEERIANEKAAATVAKDRPALPFMKLQQVLVGDGRGDPMLHAMEKLDNPKDIKAACQYLVDNSIALYSRDPDSGKIRTPRQTLGLLESNFNFAVGEWAKRGTEDIWRKEMAAAVKGHHN